MAMRRMDGSNRGYLTNDKVYGLIKQQLELQQKLFTIKRIVIGLLVFIILLTLSNLGTSFAAAYLAKDTSTNDKGELVSSSTGAVVATQTTAEIFEVERVHNTNANNDGDTDERNRHLDYSVTTSSYIAMKPARARNLICHCLTGDTVTVRRKWLDGFISVIPICWTGVTVSNSGDCTCGSGGVYESGDCSIGTVESSIGIVTITKNVDNIWYTIDGDPFTQNENQKCDYDEDCDGGLFCDGGTNKCVAHKWYVNWSDTTCVQDCVSGGSCGGLADASATLFDDKTSCCGLLPWIPLVQCLDT